MAEMKFIKKLSINMLKSLFMRMRTHFTLKRDLPQMEEKFLSMLK